MNANQELWEKGDFTRIADSMRDSGKALVESFAITPGLKVLELGGGDGTTAIPTAELGANVTVVDIARNLVDAGNKRAKQLGLDNCVFQQGDATNLSDIADDAYDLTVSIFGAMFAPDPIAVAKEMVRVTKPGGRIIMGNWIPNDPTLVAQILKISAAFTPPPPAGFISPILWGVEQEVIDRFANAGVEANNIEFFKETFHFNYAGSPVELLNLFRDFYGPTMNAFAAAKNDGKSDQLQTGLEDLFTSQNTSGSDNLTSIPATFLKVVVNV